MLRPPLATAALIAVPAAALVALGAVGIARAEQLAGGATHYFARQLAWALLATLVVVLLAAGPSYRRYIAPAYALLGAAALLLAVVLLMPAVNGAHRWIPLGRFSLQPSEFAKLAYVAALARYLRFRPAPRRLADLAWPLLLTAVPLVLILREPDLGTAMVFVPLFLSMIYAAGATRRALASLAIVALLVAPLLWSQMTREQRSRVTALAEQNLPAERPTSDGYHLHQAKLVLCLGGRWGSWLQGDVAGDRAAYHLPAAHTDFIAAVLGERLGLPGPIAVLLLYTLLVVGALRAAEQTQERFGRLLAVGIASLFGAQALINAAMSVGLAPVTGLSLPLVSYGGSGMLAHAAALGLLLNIALRPGYDLTL